MTGSRWRQLIYLLLCISGTVLTQRVASTPALSSACRRGSTSRPHGMREIIEKMTVELHMEEKQAPFTYCGRWIYVEPSSIRVSQASDDMMEG